MICRMQNYLISKKDDTLIHHSEAQRGTTEKKELRYGGGCEGERHRDRDSDEVCSWKKKCENRKHSSSWNQKRITVKLKIKLNADRISVRD